MGNRKRNRDTPELIARDLGQRLRSVFRQYDELRQPVSHFTKLTNLPAEEPSYYVHLRPGEQLRTARGITIGCLKIDVPHEGIADQAWELAITIWHLRDVLSQWVRATGSTVDVEDHCNRSFALRVCSDLANHRKHRRNENKSGRNPQIANSIFDTSKSGVLNIAYEGRGLVATLAVTNPIPIPVSIAIGLEGSRIEDGMAVFDAAIRDWAKLIHQLGILDPTDPRDSLVLDRLTEIEQSPAIPITEVAEPQFPPNSEVPAT